MFGICNSGSNVSVTNSKLLKTKNKELSYNKKTNFQFHIEENIYIFVSNNENFAFEQVLNWTKLHTTVSSSIGKNTERIGKSLIQYSKNVLLFTDYLKNLESRGGTSEN